MPVLALEWPFPQRTMERGAFVAAFFLLSGIVKFPIRPIVQRVVLFTGLTNAF